MENRERTIATLIGTTWIGNVELLNDSVSEEKGIVGIFASEKSDAVADLRDQWSMELGESRSTISGVFRTRSEKSILKNVLRNGGRAIWIVDRRLPTVYSRICSRAFMEGRLLVASCFWIDKGTYGTACYCAEVVQLLCSRVVVWAPSKRGHMPHVLARAARNGKSVEIH